MPQSFADFSTQGSDARFTDWLRMEAEPFWTRATSHRFTVELADDVLDDAVYARYLIQDYVFLEALVSHVGFAVGHAPAMPQKARYSGFLAVLTSEENDYFERSFAALGVSAETWRNAVPGSATQGLIDLFAEAQAMGSYAAILATLVPVEWVYLAWAMAQSGKKPSRFYYNEWITLHDDPGFRDFVEWMRTELDREGAAAEPDTQSHLRDLFRRACDLEVQFFETPYAP